MKIIVQPSKIKGRVLVPPSKSCTHRAIILASLAKGQSTISNCLMADDTLYTLSALKVLGTKINIKENDIKIDGQGGKFQTQEGNNVIFVGNSGTTIRLLTSLTALTQGQVILNGKERLCQRPIEDLLLALRTLGIKAESLKQNGCPPIKVEGGVLKGGKVAISGKISSQFISSLLLVAPLAQKDTIIKIKDELKSKPYVDITCDMMKKFGVQVRNNNYQEFFIKAGQSYQAQRYKVEGDYSSASYFFAAAALTQSKITVKGLNINSAQGDKYFLDLMVRAGCKVKKDKEQTTIRGPQKLRSLKVIDMGDYPDIVQSLVVVAACGQGQTAIVNIGHLRFKETDRVESTATELRKMKIRVKTSKDSLTIWGNQPEGAKIKTYNDHRMALSFAILGLKAKGETIIKNAEVVSKSYPNFFKDLKKLGAKVRRIK